LDAIGITRLGLTVSGLFLTGVVLKAVPKVVPYRAHDPVFITFLELIGNILVQRRGLAGVMGKKMELLGLVLTARQETANMHFFMVGK